MPRSCPSGRSSAGVIDRLRRDASRLRRVRPGIHCLSASSVGYKSVVTPEYIVSAATPFIEIELEEDATQLEAVTVVPSPFRGHGRKSRRTAGHRVCGRSKRAPAPTATSSRIVRSYPGVSFSPVGYRNDLIVRGGGPSENKFYHGRHRNPQYQPFRHAGRHGRSREHPSMPT